MTVRYPFALALAFALAPPLSVQAQDPHAHDHGTPPDRLGRVSFPVSCTPEASARFERAVALLHSFWWSEADRAFRSVAEADPTCAMAYWGTAMVRRGNPFAGAPAPDAVRAGLAAAERALALNPRTDRERGYASAVHALFAGADARDLRTGLLAYEEGMRELRDAHPDDVEAAVFYALAVTSNATPGDRSFERQKRAGAILEPLFERYPDHPGLAHYLIHTYDAPPIAHLGVEAARRYGRIAPAVPHAQHMPSHIFTRLGLWEESIESNRGSAEAARAYEEAQGMEAVSFDRAHAWDYLVYAYLQQGRDAEAEAIHSEMRGSTATPSIATDYAYAAIPARLALERGRWSDAEALPVRPSPGFRAGEAITHFARGIGSARSGDPVAARTEAATLAAIGSELAGRGESYWSQAVDAQRLAVEAWIALEAGATENALLLIARAAELEERIDKHPVTPGPILPARELQGDLLMELGRHADALRAYEQALEHEPGRARTLFGAARAAELSGDADGARARYAEYLRHMGSAGGDIQEVGIARAFLATH
jgi:tetratricopeptide (TPR) repeat protein